MRLVLAVVDDLIFQSKLREAAQRAGTRLVCATTSPPPDAVPAEEPWDLVILDLGLTWTDPLAVLEAVRRRAPQARIIGYCPHVDVALQAKAYAAGCSEVIPRSALARRLPDLLGETPERRQSP